MTQELNRKLNILIVTQWFDPEPTFKGLTFAKELRARGHNITVVTGFPNYPGGKLYPGYRLAAFKSENVEGINVKRVFLYPSHDSSKLGRVLNYLSFFLSSIIYLLVFAPKVDVVYAYHPPATTGLSVAISRLIRRTPTVLDVQDMWPDTLRATAMINNKTALTIIGALCQKIYNHVDHVVVLSRGFSDLLVRRSVQAAKVSVIPNWGDELPFQSTALPQEVLDGTTFKVLFSGNMGEAQGLSTILDAAELLLTTHPKVTILMLGSGVALPDLQLQKEKKNLKNVVFLPRVAKTEVGAYMRAVDCLLVHLKPDPLFAITIPSKTQAYLEAGKPIVMAVQGDAAMMVIEANAGVVAQPGHPKDIASAIVSLSLLPRTELVKLGQNGRSYYQKNLSLSKGVSRFEDVFYHVCKAE